MWKFTSFYFSLFSTLILFVLLHLLEFILSKISYTNKNETEIKKLSKIQSFFKLLGTLNNIIYSIMSAIFTIVLYYNYYISYNIYIIDHLLFLYYCSKLYEFLDVIIILFQGSSVGKHFRIHHLTTLLVTWCGLYGPLLLIDSDSILDYNNDQYYNNHNNQSINPLDLIIPSVLLNTFHHFFIYSYLGLKFHFSLVKKFGLVLPYTGAAQLIIGLISIAVNSYNFIQSKTYHISVMLSQVFILIMYAVYLMLHYEEVQLARKMEREAKQN